MSKIQRYGGNFPPFARDFQSQERTSFGTEDVGEDSLDGNINADWLRGWGIISPSEFPPIQYFNALGFTLSQTLAYLHQQGVPEWNSAQEYFEGSIAQKDGELYVSQTGTDGAPNTGTDPANDDGTNWLAVSRISTTVQTIDVGGSTNVTLTTEQNKFSATELVGTLTADIAVIVPDVARYYFVVNSTDGGFDLTFRTSTGSGVVVRPGNSLWVYSDGANIHTIKSVADQSFAGDPNGNLAADTLYERAWDSNESPPVLYVATAADGTVGGTTWEQIGGGGGGGVSFEVNPTLYDTVAINYPGDQIATNLRKMFVDGDKIHALSKGSYSGNDNALLESFQFKDGTLVSLGYVELGVGFNSRAGELVNGWVFVWGDDTIKTVDVRGTAPVVVNEIDRPSTHGFVENVSLINGFLVAPCWGSSHIEVWDPSNAVPSLVHAATTSGDFNAGVVSDGYRHFMIRYVDNTGDQVVELEIGRNGRINSQTGYNFTEMKWHRNGLINDGMLYTGSINSSDPGDLVVLDITGGAPVVDRTLPNMRYFVYERGKLYGYVEGQASGMYEMDPVTGSYTLLTSDTGDFNRSSIYGNYAVYKIPGDEGNPAGAQSNDGELGEDIGIVQMYDFADEPDFPYSPTVELTDLLTGRVNERQYNQNGLSAGDNLLFTVSHADENDFRHIGFILEVMVLEAQTSPADQNFRYFRAIGWRGVSNNDGTATERIPMQEVNGAGSYTGVTPYAAQNGARIEIGVNAGSANSDAYMLYSVKVFHSRGFENVGIDIENS